MLYYIDLIGKKYEYRKTKIGQPFKVTAFLCYLCYCNFFF